MDEELKPCPFCGGDAGVSEIRARHAFSAYCSGRSHQCAVTVETAGYESRERAIAAWNTRRNDLVIEDLSMLIRMMVTKHRRGNLDEEYCQKAMDYLQREGLQGSVLRAS